MSVMLLQIMIILQWHNFYHILVNGIISHFLNTTFKSDDMNAPTPPYLNTLVDCHKKMMEEGYKEDFMIDDDQLKCVSNDKKYNPADVKIINFFRFEGQSNPEDSSIMYVIETNDGEKGTIVDAYGAYADPDISSFITGVEKIEKKTAK